MKNLLYNIFKLIKDFFAKKPVVETPVIEPVIPSEPVVSEKLLWYPKAVIPKRKMSGAGTYQHGYPQGAIVHFTAGQDRKEQDALDSYEWGCDQGYVFFVIGPTGIVYQGFPLNVRGSHAGTSAWPGLGDSVSKYLVGIEVACAGELDGNGKSWFGVTYPEIETRRVSEQALNGEGPTGQYKRFTIEQEKALIDLLVWLKKNNPDVFNIDYVLSHSEVSGKKTLGYWRKSDISGSLSITMKKLRELLKDACK